MIDASCSNEELLREIPKLEADFNREFLRAISNIKLFRARLVTHPGRLNQNSLQLVENFVNQTQKTVAARKKILNLQLTELKEALVFKDIRANIIIGKYYNTLTESVHDLQNLNYTLDLERKELGF